jgi:hypothetical protein
VPRDSEERAPAPGGFAGLLSQVRPDPGEGKTLEQVLARAMRPDRPDEPADVDAHDANLLTRGYRPGGLTDLARQLADVEADLAAEEEKFERARKHQERLMRDHQAGKITVFDIARMQDVPGGEGDQGRAALLRRRRERLRRQLVDMSGAIAPQRQAPADPLEAAASRAHAAFVEATRARLTEAPQPRAPRPFAEASGDGGGTPDCPGCQAIGVTRSESAQIHGGEITRTTSGDGMSQAAGLYSGVIVR